MSKYRVSKYDAPEPIKKKSAEKPGKLPESRIPIYDAKGRRRGHVGRKASEATVARFGVTNAKLGKKDGRDAWLGSNVIGGYGSAQNKKLAKSLRASKGSVSK